MASCVPMEESAESPEFLRTPTGLHVRFPYTVRPVFGQVEALSARFSDRCAAGRPAAHCAERWPRPRRFVFMAGRVIGSEVEEAARQSVVLVIEDEPLLRRTT